MRLTFVKRLIVYLVAAAFIGAPWVQALAQIHAADCAASAMTTSADMALHNDASGDAARHKTDPATKMSFGCAKSCVAPLNLMTPRVSLPFEGWTQVYEPAARAALEGRTLEPELSPPIERA